MLLCTWAPLRASHSRQCKGATPVCFALIFKGFLAPAPLEQGAVRQPCARKSNPHAARACTLVRQRCSRIATHKMQNSPGDGLQAALRAQHCKTLRVALQPKLQCNRLGLEAAAKQACESGRAAAQATSMQRQSATIRVEVVVGSARLLVPCGQGERTVAWLLQQVEKRLSSSHQVCAAEHTLMGWAMAVMWLPEPAS